MNFNLSNEHLLIGVLLVGAVYFIIKYVRSFLAEKNTKASNSDRTPSESSSSPQGNPRSESRDAINALRLQAYERMCLFLERINPENLLRRVQEPNMKAVVLRGRMLEEIRQEYEYNLSQQLYMSHQAWVLIRMAMEDILSAIYRVSQQLEPEDEALTFAKALLDERMNESEDLVQQAVQQLRQEVLEID